MEQEFAAQLKQLELYLRPSRFSLNLGLHELRHRGRSLEFAEYREYRPGEDIRDLDWKLLARTEKHYVKQRDTHTPASVLVLLDHSASMKVHSEQAAVSKLHAASLFAFGLIYILHSQRDSFSFQLLDGTNPVAPRSSKKAFQHILLQLKQLQQNAQEAPLQTDFPTLRPQIADHLFLLSDFMVPTDQWSHWLKQVRIASRCITFLRVLDPIESSPEGQLQQLMELEAPTKRRWLAADGWKQYRENFKKHETQLDFSCKSVGIRQKSLSTRPPLLTRIHTLLSELSISFS